MLKKRDLLEPMSARAMKCNLGTKEGRSAEFQKLYLEYNGYTRGYTFTRDEKPPFVLKDFMLYVANRLARSIRPERRKELFGKDRLSFAQRTIYHELLEHAGELIKDAIEKHQWSQLARQALALSVENISYMDFNQLKNHIEDYTAINTEMCEVQ